MEKITIYIENPLKIGNLKAYEINKINYELNGRKMISNKNGRLELNSFFIDEMKEYSEKEINHIYLYFINNIENPDADFDIGFNNIENNFEIEMIFQKLFLDNSCFVLLKPNNFEQKTGLFNKESADNIWKKYKICYEIEDKKEYTVRIKEFQELVLMNNYIKAFLFDFDGSNLVKSINFNDKRNLDEIVSMCSYIVVRTQYFSGYNLSIFTEKNIDEILDKICSFFQNKNIEYRAVNINRIGD